MTTMLELIIITLCAYTGYGISLHRNPGYERVPAGDEIALLKAVAHQPVFVTIAANSTDFREYAGGVFKGKCGPYLDHDMIIMGYGVDQDGITKYWLLKNSWGTWWGEDGYMRMLRDTSDPKGLCGITLRAWYPIITSKFGEDEFGHMLVDILKQNGVETGGVLFDKDARTALAFVTLLADGEREFMFYRNPSADMLLREKELNMDLILRSSIFHYGSISLISEPCRSAHLAAMHAVKAAGILCSYDPNVRLPLWSSQDAARDGIMSIWTLADFIKISDDEVEFLTNGDPQDENNVLSLWFDGLKLLLVTDGEKGCRYFTQNFKGKVDGYAVNTVDTTGAGDAFVGAFLVSISKDRSILEDENKLRGALQFANVCGAICTTKKGAIPALPTIAMAMELSAQHKP